MFYVGQKVVKLESHRVFKKGDTAIITEIANCLHCGELHISLDKDYGGTAEDSIIECYRCEKEIKSLPINKWVSAARFWSPIEEYCESYSIAIQLVQEMEQVDKQKVFNPKKETV